MDKDPFCAERYGTTQKLHHFTCRNSSYKSVFFFFFFKFPFQEDIPFSSDLPSKAVYSLHSPQSVFCLFPGKYSTLSMETFHCKQHKAYVYYCIKCLWIAVGVSPLLQPSCSLIEVIMQFKWTVRQLFFLSVKNNQSQAPWDNFLYHFCTVEVFP